MSRSRQRPGLSREKVVAAALAIVDRDGVPALTMRALGRELGVDPMAVYYHVPHKTAILDGVVEAVWAELVLPEPTPMPTSQPWQEELAQIARAIRDTLRRHPHALPVMAARPNRSLAGFRVVDRTLGVLRRAGLPAGDALELVNAAGEFLLGHALAEAGPHLPGMDPDDQDILAALDQAQLVEQLPHLARAVAEVDLRTVTMDRIFEAGLTALRRGIEDRLAELA